MVLSVAVMSVLQEPSFGNLMLHILLFLQEATYEEGTFTHFLLLL